MYPNTCMHNFGMHMYACMLTCACIYTYILTLSLPRQRGQQKHRTHIDTHTHGINTDNAHGLFDYLNDPVGMTLF